MMMAMMVAMTRIAITSITTTEFVVVLITTVINAVYAYSANTIVWIMPHAYSFRSARIKSAQFTTSRVVWGQALKLELHP